LEDRLIVHRSAKPASRHEPPSASLEESIQKIRKLMAEARPEAKPALQTLETRDSSLKDALTAYSTAVTAGNAVAVAAVYHRYGLLDEAYSYYSRALALDPKSAMGYEGLARVWRDWRLPHLGVGDAVRATYYAPESAAAQNTLGTILQALGRRKDARNAYRAALARDSHAAYALNNLCYLSFVEGDAPRAVQECHQAIAIDPALAAAHNNLGLTYAAIGRTDLANEEFAHSGGAAVATYNMGVVYLAQRQYARAADQFEHVPAGTAVADAPQRAREARRLARTSVEAGEQE
jgi:tetratricopeptide (TPR) repeat protein